MNSVSTTKRRSSEAERAIRLNSFGVISLLPEVFAGWQRYGLVGKAFTESRLQIHHENPREYSTRSAAAVDDKPYGGGPGMLLQQQPVEQALQSLQTKLQPPALTVLLAAHGKQFDYRAVNRFLSYESVLFICGRYEGIDARIELREDIEVWSIGNFILNGGELAAMVMMETLARHIPGVLGDEQSAVEDSFTDHRLDYPHYTRPMVYNGSPVPKVLLSGNHQKIHLWRNAQALGRMWDSRPDLLKNLAPMAPEEWKMLYAYVQNRTD